MDLNRATSCIMKIWMFIILVLCISGCCEPGYNFEKNKDKLTNPQQAVYNLCKEKGGIPIVNGYFITDCIFPYKWKEMDRLSIIDSSCNPNGN
jgi:hypothetical protein